MLLWFVGASMALVWIVFQSPALDYRLVAGGSLLPLLDGVTGGPFVLHALLASVVLLAAVMLTTRRRRLVRRRWLGIPIGTFLHLVLDGAWMRSALFWWPFLGGDAFDGRLPELDRSPFLVVALEVAGVAALAWLWQGFGLGDHVSRRRFLTTGQLPRVR
ncbi:MAG: hypothetical protein ACRD0G_03045 [Acidimicrobiales bacterium]